MSMRAYLVKQHNTVEWEELGGVLFVALHMNEQRDGNKYVYDYHEFSCDPAEVDIEDVKAHPDKYMTYGDEVDLEQENRELKTQVEALNESLSFMEDCIVEMAEILYK